MTEQAAKCVLKLNTPVLNALFPEGTEARVQLINAALTEVTNTYVKTALSQHVMDHLRTLTQEVKQATDITAIVKQYFDYSGLWNATTKLKVGTKFTDAIARAVESAFEDRLMSLITERVEARVANYEDTLEYKVDQAVKQRVERLTTDAIQKRVDAAVNAARAAM